MIEVSGEDAEDFKREPLHPKSQGDDCHRQNDARSKAVERRVMDANRQVREHERQSRSRLRLVAQAVRDNGGGDREHEEEIQLTRFDQVRGRYVIDGIADEIEESPTSGGACTRENTVALIRFVTDTNRDHCRAQTDAQRHFPGRSHVL